MRATTYSCLASRARIHTKRCKVENAVRKLTDYSARYHDALYPHMCAFVWIPLGPWLAAAIMGVDIHAAAQRTPSPQKQDHGRAQGNAACFSTSAGAVGFPSSPEHRLNRSDLDCVATASAITAATSARLTNKRMPGKGSLSSCPVTSRVLPAGPSASPQGFTMVEPMPELPRNASPFSFQKRSLPPSNGSGFGFVVSPDEHRTTRSSSMDVLLAASAATWFSSPPSSSALISFSSPPAAPPTATATVVIPWKAACRLDGCVMSPT
mmetsp:Transcript_34125/g.67953  ORF Transcript_34125/g.67953 Transcript_34125/m.67953 type:complete len:266 (+) Transcript_34125:106-903(+)